MLFSKNVGADFFAHVYLSVKQELNISSAEKPAFRNFFMLLLPGVVALFIHSENVDVETSSAKAACFWLP